MVGKRLIVRTLCSVLLVIYVASSFISMTPFDPGGSNKAAIEALLKPNICDKSDEVVILVHSHAANFELRSSQRKSGKLSKNHLKFMFILFKSPSVELSEIHKEHSIHGDILLGDKEESYYNLVNKHIMGLYWTEENCPDVEYIIKMDDDISVDFNGLLAVVNKNKPKKSKWMMGMLQMKLPILRNKISKWAVTEEEFSGQFYPDFLSGWLYVSTPSAVRDILNLVEDEDMFWIDDVWVTGVLARKAEVELISLNMYYTVYREHLDCCLHNTSLQCPYLVGPSDGDHTVIEQAASHADNCRTRRETCKRRRTKDQDLSNSCKITNPLFIPSSRVFAEVIVV
eukprot:TRINITY_DN10592_c0_g1_i4.p1 TRINITY_DN10592_c0_g1~~TRINITY_DN10592_c0_g1_i4.p1  ORF type:complete len:341 (-),score=63.75 TRINITY_DN10592_c0_g1_i4:28-1050(-)